MSVVCAAIVNDHPFKFCACLVILMGLFLCGCDGSDNSFAEPQKVYALSQSTVSPSATQIGGFWLKSVDPPQTAASGSVVLVKQISPIGGTESTLRWYATFPAEIYPDLSDQTTVYRWYIYAVERDENGVYILVSMQEK